MYILSLIKAFILKQNYIVYFCRQNCEAVSTPNHTIAASIATTQECFITVWNPRPGGTEPLDVNRHFNSGSIQINLTKRELRTKWER